MIDSLPRWDLAKALGQRPKAIGPGSHSRAETGSLPQSFGCLFLLGNPITSTEPYSFRHITTLFQWRLLCLVST